MPTNLHTCFSRSRFNMPSVVPVCFLVSVLVCADAAALTTKEDAAEVVVGADAKQIMRNAKKGDATAKKDTAPTKLVSINLYYETRCPIASSSSITPWHPCGPTKISGPI